MQIATDTGYDLGLPPALEQARPAWFDEVPWHRCRDRELPDDAIATLEYMDLIEGHVCAGYLHLALASATVRATTERTDFAAGWGVQENWHGIALHRFLDEYRGIRVSTRGPSQDARRARLGFAERHSQLVAGVAGSIAPELYAAVYACLGYRNEVMTMRGYGSLRSKLNDPDPHPVLDPLLRNLMRDEAHHARFYRRIASAHLEASPRARRAARSAMERWWGIVGENFAGSEGADRVILYLFRDRQGRDLADKIDAEVATLPGLAGVKPMRRRLEEALGRAGFEDGEAG
ncbi:MAG TPA: hypothetical protein VM840_09795 [Actinomycetota bacterium]|nr:hypothetical protein [Actinomycetota bacterium]